MSKIIKIISLIFVFLLILNQYGASAQTITKVQDISFGTFVLKNNTSNHTITISTTGATTFTGDIIMLSLGNNGEYTLTGFPPNTALGITIGTGLLSINGSGTGETMTFDSNTHNSPVTDGAGNATLLTGATITTSGSGTMYPDGTYSEQINITVSY